MTLIELPTLSRLRILWRAAWPTVVAVLVLIVFAAVLHFRAQAAAENAREAKRLAEKDSLEAKGLIVSAQESQKALDSRVKALTGQNAALAAELDKARKAAKGARVVGVVAASTGPGKARGAAPEAPARPEGDEAPSAAPCLVSEGDDVEIRADEVLLQTKAGNRLLVGTASLWRLNPLPIGPVFSGAFQAPVTEAAEVKPVVREATWGAGVYGFCAAEGCGAGPRVALPPVHVWRFQIEADAGATIVGRPSFAAGAVVRFR